MVNYAINNNRQVEEMTLRTQWPEHKELTQPRKSDFDTFHPAVADAMREQGMESFNQLADRIQWILDQPEMSDMFNVQFQKNVYHAAISAENKNGEAYLHSKAHGFTKVSQLIALALEKSPEDLFKHVPESSIYLEEQKQDENQVDAEYARRIGLPDLQIDIARVVSTLRDREQKVLERRYGLNGYDGSNEQLVVAAEFGVSGQRIGQLEKVAMRKLRAPKSKDLLRAYLNDHWSINGVETAVSAGITETVDNDEPSGLDM